MLSKWTLWKAHATISMNIRTYEHTLYEHTNQAYVIFLSIVIFIKWRWIWLKRSDNFNVLRMITLTLTASHLDVEIKIFECPEPNFDRRLFQVFEVHIGQQYRCLSWIFAAWIKLRPMVQNLHHVLLFWRAEQKHVQVIISGSWLQVDAQTVVFLSH